MITAQEAKDIAAKHKEEQRKLKLQLELEEMEKQKAKNGKAMKTHFQPMLDAVLVAITTYASRGQNSLVMDYTDCPENQVVLYAIKDELQKAGYRAFLDTVNKSVRYSDDTPEVTLYKILLKVEW